MADQRQPFRFRRPWLPPTATPAAPPPPTPTTTSNRPRLPAPAPVRPPAPAPVRPPAGAATTAPPPRQPAAPPPRPPFRPAGVGPTQSLPRAGPPPPTPSPSPPKSSVSTPASPKTDPSASSVSTLAEAKTTNSRPISPPIQPPSSPSSSSPPSPQEKAVIVPHNSPKREPSPTTMVDQTSSPKKPSSSSPPSPREKAVIVPHNSPIREPYPTTLVDQTSSPKKEPEKLVAQSQTKMVSDEVPEVVHKKEMITTSEVGQRQKLIKPNHNHKSAPLKKEIKEDISKLVHKLGISQGKQTLDGEKQLTVITLAGENRGASMTLSNESRKKESPIHIHRGYRANPDEGIENSTENKEESSKTDEETATNAYINSNVQGINNSLLFNGSVSTMNPGVRYVRNHDLPESSNGGRRRSLDAHKAEVSGTQSEMLAYAPNVRRRCLRGLLMESSDSDTEKPRRHGCYFDRKGKNKSEDGDVDIL